MLALPTFLERALSCCVESERRVRKRPLASSSSFSNCLDEKWRLSEDQVASRTKNVYLVDVLGARVEVVQFHLHPRVESFIVEVTLFVATQFRTGPADELKGNGFVQGCDTIFPILCSTNFVAISGYDFAL